MQKVWIISDTHFGHHKILEFEKEKRPYYTIQDHDWDLVQRWNSVVNPNDTVWHLGDVWFGKDGHTPLAYLNGIKKLVLGNHDHYPIEVYKKYFSRIFGLATFGRVLLSHAPVHPGQLQFRYTKNIHGHLHSDVVRDGYHQPDKRYVNVSCEHTDLKPTLLSAILSST